MNPADVPGSSAIADVLLLRNRPGVLTPPLRHECGQLRPVAGPVRTVLFEATSSGSGSTFDELYQLLDQDLSGAVVVAAGAEQVVGAVWGQILNQAAERSGAVAVVVAGAVRDHAELAESRLPVWGLSRHTAGATGQARVLGIDVNVRVADAAIGVGDIVVADHGGVVCLPQNDAALILEQARTYADAERQVLEDITAGAPLDRAYDHKRAARKLLADP